MNFCLSKVVGTINENQQILHALHLKDNISFDMNYLDKCLISNLSHRFQMLEETKGEGKGHHPYLNTFSSQNCPIQHLHKYPILRPNVYGILFINQNLYLTNLFECWA